MESIENEDETTTAMQRRRERIVAELLSTEDAYRKQLQVMVDYFETPMRIRQVIPNHAVDAIFGNVHQLIRVNHELRSYLDDCEVGEAFLKIGPFLKLYSVYAKNHHHALCTYEEWEHKSARLLELRQRQECRPEVKMKFNALLITPVQRIPRYKMLLDDLLNHTLPVHTDYLNLKQAAEEIAQVASHINNFIREHDNFNKMLQIQRSLSGNCAPKILGPGRKFIMEGPLKRVSRKGGRAYERMFFLFSDMILYAKPRLVENSNNTSYSCCCVLPLHHCRVERMFGGAQTGGAMMRLSCKDELLLLYHEDCDKIEVWIAEMKKAIKEVCQSRQSLHKESSARRPMRKAELSRTRRQERLEQMRDSPRTPRSPSTSMKENSGVATTPLTTGSPLVKYVRNLTDIDKLCCTPRKKLHLEPAKSTDDSVNEKLTKDVTAVTEDSFCIADQSEVENFDVTLPTYFRNMDIRKNGEAPDDTSIHDDDDLDLGGNFVRINPINEAHDDKSDLNSVSGRTSIRKSMRRSLSNMSQYSTKLRSSFRNLKQKTSSCSLRLRTRTSSNHVRLDELFGPTNDRAPRLSSIEVDERDLSNDNEAFESSATISANQNTALSDATTISTNRNAALSDVTNTTPTKKQAPPTKRTLLSLANEKRRFKLKRRLDHVVDHVMSPVMESTPVKRPGATVGVSMGGFNLVENLQNVRHLADSVKPTGQSPSIDAACVLM